MPVSSEPTRLSKSRILAFASVRAYRAFSREVLETVNYEANNDDFVFDNEMISQIFMAGFEIAEITCPTKYFEEASSINFSRSMKYGLGVLGVSFGHFFYKLGLNKNKIYEKKK